MDNDEVFNLDYQKGFNEGYIITEHLPDLSDKLVAIDSQAPRLDGFREGRKEFALEQIRKNRPQWMNPPSPHEELPEPEKGTEIEPDIDR